MMNTLFIVPSFLVSLLVTMLVVKSIAFHGAFSADHDLTGPQKFHAYPVPRVGGVAIALAVVAGTILLNIWHAGDVRLLWLLLLSSVPAFVGGLAEDITKRVSPRWRLALTALSAGLAAWLIEALVQRTGIALFDAILQFVPLAVLVTVFMVSGLANAVNIIDGFNGLASMCMMLILAAMAYVAYQVGDQLLCTFALTIIGALLGFFVWNFPKGLIFLGDGGAYFVGFLLGELSILLILRNPAVSPWFPILLCAYPIFETVFSIYRRRVLRGTSPSDADGMHLHSLVYKRVMRLPLPVAAQQSTRRNSMTSPYLWVLCLLSVAPAVAFWYSNTWLVLWCVAFVGLYLSLYWRIVRFKTPRWLVRRF